MTSVHSLGSQAHNDDSADGARDTAPLVAAGLAGSEIAEWEATRPAGTGAYAADVAAYGRFWSASARLLAALPEKPGRSAREAQAAVRVLAAARDARERFLSAHAVDVYDRVTGNRSRLLRLDELLSETARAVPGLVPGSAEIAAEATRDQRDKEGAEVDQGLFLSHVLADRRAGTHLCHAMLLPRAESAGLAERFAAEGVLDFGCVRLERRGSAVLLTAGNPRFLNAEDDTTLDAMEVAVDVAILDPGSGVLVLRGAPVAHAKFAGRRVFGAGINLTHLYRGRIPYLWFLRRDMGYVHKLLRGVATPDAVPDDVHGHGIEKPWIAAVDGFAIGGHCQLLLCADYVVASAGAYLSLPARKEGFIPGLANLRLPRIVGERLARQAIQYGRVLACDSAEGRLVCDEVVSSDGMDAAIARAAAETTEAGLVGTVGNRRALRLGTEPLDFFRRYCAVYAREQAHAYVSPALIANLERHWNAAQRVA